MHKFVQSRIKGDKEAEKYHVPAHPNKHSQNYEAYDEKAVAVGG